MSKNEWSHFAFHILIPKYILLKNKIYIKIQREQLYKLQTKIHLNNIDFVLKKKQNFVRPIFADAKAYRTEFGVFSTRKLQKYNRLFFAKCRTFKAVSHGISCFF